MRNEVKKVHVTVSLPTDTNKNLATLATQYGMTKSGLINLLVNKVVADNGKIF